MMAFLLSTSLPKHDIESVTEKSRKDYAGQASTSTSILKSVNKLICIMFRLDKENKTIFQVKNTLNQNN